MSFFLFFLLFRLFFSYGKVASSPDEDAECNKESFIRKYVQPNRYVNVSMSSMFKCKVSKNKRKCYLGSTFVRYHLNDTLYFTVGGTKSQKKKVCWGYLLQLFNRKRELLHQKYYGFEDNETHENFTFKWKIKYKETFLTRYIGFPYSDTFIELPLFKMPNGLCELKAMLYGRKYCSSTNKCGEEQGNFVDVANGFCKTHRGIAEEREDFYDVFLSNIDTKFNVLVLKPPTKEITLKIKWYIWLPILIISVIVMAFTISWLCRKKKQSDADMALMETDDNEDNNNPREKNISVIILHQPGCQELNPLVETLETMIKDLHVNVTSPFMGNQTYDGQLQQEIDAQIRNSNLVIIVCAHALPNEPCKQTSHKGFVYTLKMVPQSGFARGKFIIFYMENYETSLNNSIIPLRFMGMRSFKIPFQLTYFSNYMLTGSIRKPNQLPKEKKHIIRDAWEKLKPQVKRFLKKKHYDCDRRDCSKGVMEQIDDKMSIFSSEKSIINGAYDLDEINSFKAYPYTLRKDTFLDMETDRESNFSFQTSYTLAYTNLHL